MTTITSEEKIIYYGARDHTFKDLISNVLQKANLKSHYIQLLLSEENLKIFDQVFTSSTANPETNYEIYEILGDVTFNKCLVWYFNRRFPQLFTSEGVKIIARLRINFSSKQSFCKIAEKLGFWEFISATEEERNHCKKPLLEDTLEAFFGAVEYIIDKNIRYSVGFSIVYEIITKIFDEMEISLKYEDLYDAKTRLKELFDFFGKDIMGTLKYEENKDDVSKIVTCVIYQLRPNGMKIKLGEGQALLKIDSHQKAASQSIKYLNRLGYVKEVPEIYKRLSSS